MKAEIKTYDDFLNRTELVDSYISRKLFKLYESNLFTVVTHEDDSESLEMVIDDKNTILNIKKTKSRGAIAMVLLSVLWEMFKAAVFKKQVSIWTFTLLYNIDRKNEVKIELPLV